MTTPRYCPIIRPSDETPTAYGLILGDLEGIEMHFEKQPGSFPCWGAKCRYSIDGACNREKSLKWYGPAALCEMTITEASAADEASYLEAYRQWAAKLPRTKEMDGWSAERRAAARIGEPQRPNRREAVRPVIPLRLAIAEVLDVALEKFPPSHRGLVYGVTRSRGKTIYQVRGDASGPQREAEPIPPAFDWTPALERVLKMRLAPVEPEKKFQPKIFIPEAS